MYILNKTPAQIKLYWIIKEHNLTFLLWIMIILYHFLQISNRYNLHILVIGKSDVRGIKFRCFIRLWCAKKKCFAHFAQCFNKRSSYTCFYHLTNSIQSTYFLFFKILRKCLKVNRPKKKIYSVIPFISSWIIFRFHTFNIHLSRYWPIGYFRCLYVIR